MVDPHGELRRREAARAIREVGLPQERLAEETGIARSTIAAWVRRPTEEAARAPKPDKVLELARGFREYSEKVARVAERLERVVRQQTED